MANKFVDTAVLGSGDQAIELIGNILESSAGYSIIGEDLDGNIVLWNEGARRAYGYEAEDVVGKANSALLHTPEDVASGKPREMMDAALRDGKWEGTTNRLRKNGERFTARVVITARRDASGRPSGFLLISKDISDEIRLAEELKAVQFYTRSLVESNIDALMTSDPLGVITDVNRQMEVLTGCTRDALIGTPFKSYFTDRERAKECIRLVLSQGKVTNYDLIARAKNRRETSVSCNATTLYDHDGKVRGVFAAAREITELKEAAEAQRKAGALQSAIFNSVNFSSIATDAKGVIQIFNVGAERMLGYTAAEVINKITPAEISDPEELVARAGSLSAELGTSITPGFEALVFKASRGIEDIYELTYLRKDGSRFPAVVSVTALRDAQEAIIGYLLIGTDNTARHQVEEERKKLDQRLRDQQFYTRSLIESNIDALITTNPLGTITDVNHQMELLTDCTRDQLIGTPFKNCFTDPERAEEGIRLVLSQHKVMNYELTARAQDGRETVVSYNAATFYDRNGTLQGVFAAARDVTERKLFEQTLQEKNVELENANFAKDRFLASMSHELRTPLNAIIGYTGTLLMKLPGPLNEEQGAQLRTIQSSGKHLLSLINDLLDLAKIASGKVALNLESAVFQSIVEETRTTLKPLAEKKGLRFGVSVPSDKLVFKTDRRALSQILLNLANNAIKFTEEGEVQINLRDRTDSGRRVAEISVRDTGIGIKTEDQAKLFQAFTQMGDTGTLRYEGTGLGLHLSQKLAGLLGGVITVQSQYGKGSTFTLSIPER
jgi:PAS domain S-box-containing protein